jgi:hypothetical protein
MLDSVRIMPITDKVPAAYGTSHGLRRRRKHRERVLTGENNAHAILRCVSFSPVKPANLAELRALVGDTFTYGQARQAGVGGKVIYRLRDTGDIISLGGGVYRWADAPPADHDLIEIAERVPKATICLESALARHHLIDSIPAAIDIAIPRGSTRPRLRAPVRLHHFSPATFDLGREPLDTGDRKQTGIYSAERSIVDVVRLRHREGSDIAWEALRNWLDVPGRRPAQLLDLARRFPGAEKTLRQAFEVLL